MKEAILYSSYENNKIICNLCAHHCKLSNNQTGICSVRKNINGTLYDLNYDLLHSFAIDPVEKKPFYHFLPGADVLSFGLPGCNFKCANCQNNSLSQCDISLLSDRHDNISVESLYNKIKKLNIAAIAYTYSEPTVFFEFAYELIQLCRADKESAHLKHLFISNGYFSTELCNMLISEKLIDAVNIDLKFFDNEKYRKITGASLQPVLDNISAIAESDIHLEIINLVIPGLNDSDEDFHSLAGFIADTDKNIPLHFSRFYPAYQMTGLAPTPAETLIRAADTAHRHGMKYIYLGNIALDGRSNTYCPNCSALLIERSGYNITANNLDTKNNAVRCLACSAEIPIITA